MKYYTRMLELLNHEGIFYRLKSCKNSTYK